MAFLDHDRFMARAIELSERAGLIEKTGGCFGAVVVHKATGQILGEGFNHVVRLEGA
jgi:guanine deaminase